MNPTHDLDNYRFLGQTSFWEHQPALDPKRWLGNFVEKELPFARQLLNSFVFVSDQSTRRLLRHAISQLSRFVLGDECDSFVYEKSRYQEVLLRSVVTSPTGEVPNISDSGALFTRLVRQELDFPQANLKDNAGTVKLILESGLRSVIFVDDFVGSGNQFVETIHREIEIDDEKFTFFQCLERFPDLNLYYIPIYSTEFGSKRIREKCGRVILSPVFLLDDTHSVMNPKSYIWDEMYSKEEIFEFVVTASRRAGIPDDQIMGFCGLSLGMAFQHCVPDATLPLFYHNSENWKPLKKRT